MILKLLTPVLILLFCTACWNPEPKNITMTEKNSGSRIKCYVKDTITVRLKANPTTGYIWKQAVIPDMDVVRLVGEKYIVPKHDKMVGVPGYHEFYFHVVGGGEAAIKLEYKRPWENNPPDQMFQVLISVPIKTPSKLFNDEYKAPRRGSKGQIEVLPEGI